MYCQNDLCFQLQWYCPECGEHHDRKVTITIAFVKTPLPKAKILAADPLTCDRCGHYGPIEVQTAKEIDLSIVAKPGVMLHISTSMDQEGQVDACLYSAQHPSNN